MSARGHRTGKDGEEAAARYLETRGYEILARRYRTRRGEIDLIARRHDVIAFVEVKTRRPDAGGPQRFGSPLEAVTSTKQARLTGAAEAWLATHPGCSAGLFRFDVISVRAGDDAGPVIVDHIEDAFPAR